MGPTHSNSWLEALDVLDVHVERTLQVPWVVGDPVGLEDHWSVVASGVERTQERLEVVAADVQGLDGIIVYVDQGGQPPAFYTAGWKNKLTKEPADPHAFFKIGSIISYIICCVV